MYFTKKETKTQNTKKYKNTKIQNTKNTENTENRKIQKNINKIQHKIQKHEYMRHKHKNTKKNLILNLKDKKKALIIQKNTQQMKNF